MSVMTAQAPVGGEATAEPRRQQPGVALLSVLLAVIVAASVGVVYLVRLPGPAGPELVGAGEGAVRPAAYGTFQGPAARFTDASTYLTLTAGKVTIESIDVGLSGGNLRLVGEPMV